MNILVTGSFDLLHSGHIEFLRKASSFGNLYVGIGCDASIEQLKNRPTIIKQEERLFMIKAIRYVKDAWINSGTGNMDWAQDAVCKGIKFDMLVVNTDQNTPDKSDFCRKHNIAYVVLERKPYEGLPARSSTNQRDFYGQNR